MQGARALHGHSTKLAKNASQVAGQRSNRNVHKVHEDCEYRATPQTPSAAILKTASHSFIRFSRIALAITDTELKLIAAAAMIGESSRPNTGYSTPAATGMPSTL